MGQITTANDSPSLVTTMVSAQARRWERVGEVLQRHQHKPDLDAAKAVYACIAAHRLKGAPVWPMLVGAPGSGKTTLYDGLSKLERVRSIDQITSQTFISGQIVDSRSDTNQAPPGLLQRLGDNAILIYPDFSTVLSMKAETKASILADMRRIYDGELSKEFGTGTNLETRSWKGRITFAVATTPDIDTHYSIFQSLGERFVMIRWARPDGVQAALAAMNQDSALARQELAVAVADLFAHLPSHEPTLSAEQQLRIASLADFITRARTHVPRSGYTKEMLYQPQPESSTRLAQQLCQLAKGSALLVGKSEVGDEDIRLAARVGFDCITMNRRRVIDTLRAGQKISESGIKGATLTYLKQDLEAVGILTGDHFSELARERLKGAGFATLPPALSLVVPPMSRIHENSHPPQHVSVH